MHRLSCHNCGHDVFFENTQCVDCNQFLGYDPTTDQMLSSTTETEWSADGITLKACDNRPVVGCNWLTPTDTSLCDACRHNHVIPDLSAPGQSALWANIESAKRVLFYSILAWNLPHKTKVEDPDTGLAFDFLADEPQPDGTVTQHLTGHAEGLITINIAEGDDAERERRRAEMGEPYRTLVGHFRHEIGHYYWDRLVATDPARLAEFRALFGDEQADYAAALTTHYQNGPPLDWRQSFISAYATTHPWEDFAETFAHYVHMVDGLETAAAFDIVAGMSKRIIDPYRDGTSEELIDAWVPVTVAVNAVNRSMGQPDLYPFVLSIPVFEKLAFIHELVRAQGGVARRPAYAARKADPLGPLARLFGGGRTQH